MASAAGIETGGQVPRGWRRRARDRYLGILMTGLGVAFVAAALFGRDVVGVLQALGIAGIGVHALRHPLPIDLDLRQAFSQGLEGPAATETARSATIPVTLVLASVLARFLEWLWY